MVETQLPLKSPLQAEDVATGDVAATITDELERDVVAGRKGQSIRMHFYCVSRHGLYMY